MAPKGKSSKGGKERKQIAAPDASGSEVFSLTKAVQVLYKEFLGSQDKQQVLNKCVELNQAHECSLTLLLLARCHVQHAAFVLTEKNHKELPLHSKKVGQFLKDIGGAVDAVRMGQEKYSSSVCGLFFCQLAFALGLTVNITQVMNVAADWKAEPDVSEAFSEFNEPFDNQLRDANDSLALAISESKRWLEKADSEGEDGEPLTDLQQKSRFAQKISETRLLPPKIKTKVEMRKKTQFFIQEEVMDGNLSVNTTKASSLWFVQPRESSSRFAGFSLAGPKVGRGGSVVSVDYLCPFIVSSVHVY